MPRQSRWAPRARRDSDPRPGEPRVGRSRRRRAPPRLAFLAGLLLGLPVAGAHDLTPGTSQPHAPLKLQDIGGLEHDLGQLRGRVVLVHFWASWCAPCLQEMPSLKRLASTEGPESLAVLAVNVGESELRAKAFSKRLGIDFPVLLDKDSAVFDGWGATVLPTTYVLDGEGRVRLVGRGPQEWDTAEMLQTLESLRGGG